MERSRELEDVILANRDDPEPYLVYADWLASREDPRGELIVLQYQRLLEEGHEYLEVHSALTPALERAELGWQWGFVLAVRLDNPDPDDFEELFGHPSCALLRDLILDLDSDPAPAIAALAREPRPTLETLVLHRKQLRRVRLESADGAVWAQLPALKRLTVRGASLFDGIAHARLRELVIYDGHPFGTESSWDLPSLEAITWKSRLDAELQPTWDPTAFRMLATAHLPSLRRLDVVDCVARGVIGGPTLLDRPEIVGLLGQLEVLKIALPSLDGDPERGCAILVERAPRLAHLRELGVSVTGAHTWGRAVEKVLPNVRWYGGP